MVDVDSVAPIWDLAARISNLAFEGALAGYVTAVACHAVEIAVRRAPKTDSFAAASRARARIATPDTVLTDGIGGSASIQESSASADLTGTNWGERIGRAAIVVTTVGFSLNTISIIMRGLATSRAPWGNMYEIASLICAIAAGAWLLVAGRNNARLMGLFAVFPIAVLCFVAGTVLYTPAGTLVPVLQSYWLVIHVLLVALSSGVLMLSGAASTMFILRLRHERRTTGTVDDRSFIDRLPDANTLDRLAYRTAIIGFPLFTFAVIAGALWAEASWGRYWGWDPKETVSLITWMLYAGYLHARATSGWRGSGAAWISILGFASIMFNLFFVNMVVSGLHSYAGLN